MAWSEREWKKEPPNNFNFVWTTNESGGGGGKWWRVRKMGSEQKQENLPNEIIIRLWLMTARITFSMCLNMCCFIQFSVGVSLYGYCALVDGDFNSFNESSMPKNLPFRKSFDAETPNKKKTQKLKLQIKWQMNKFVRAQRIFPQIFLLLLSVSDWLEHRASLFLFIRYIFFFSFRLYFYSCD